MKTMRLCVSLAVAALCAAALADGHQLKMRIAVAPLDWSDHMSLNNYAIPVEFQNAIYEKMVKKLMDTGKFVVLERDAMEAMLNEKAIKEDNTGQSQKGKIIPAQALIKGKLTDFNLASKGVGGGVGINTGFGNVSVGGSVTEAKMGINVRIFDAETSEMIASEDASKVAQSHSISVGATVNSVSGNIGAFDSTPLGEATTKAISEAVDKIVKDLGGQPWSAYVADWDSNAKEVTINAGSDLGVQVGDAFDIYKVSKVIKDPETGAILGKKTVKSGSIKITSVDKKFAVGIPIEGSDFSTGDIVKEQK